VPASVNSPVSVNQPLSIAVDGVTPRIPALTKNANVAGTLIASSKFLVASLTS
jgi:hypothetical protein